jgi:hypothetical protein
MHTWHVDMQVDMQPSHSAIQLCRNIAKQGHWQIKQLLKVQTHFMSCKMLACDQNLSFPETHTKRQATQHGCMPSFLGDRYNWIEIVYVRKKYFELGRLGQPRQDKNLLYRHKSNEPTQGRTPFICTPWVPIHFSFKSQQGVNPLSSLWSFPILWGSWTKNLLCVQEISVLSDQKEIQA